VEGFTRFWQAAPPATFTVTVVKPQSEETGLDAASTDTTAATPTDDAALVTACLAGDRQAFDRIVERHQRSVYRVCYRFLGNHEDASDAAQETFVRAFRSLASFRGGSSLSTWLYRIAVNASLSRRGARRALEPIDPERHVDSGAESPEQSLSRDEQRARVRAAISRLPARQRAALILRTYHDLTHEQIAKVMGGSVGTSKANVFHALRNLKALLGGTESR
jgi:RNA polymerase sigma-70 factor (ECF subfamily)